MDNLKAGAATRLLKNWAPALFTAIALIGAVGLPLRSLVSARLELQQAELDSARAAELRSEMEAFRAAGGDSFVDELGRATIDLLPRELSSIDVRAALQLIASSCGLELSALSVGEFTPTTYTTLDDSVALAEISLSGRGGPGALSRLLSSVRVLGYPVTVRNFQLDRLDANDSRFDVHAVLEIYQAIPKVVAPQSEDSPVEEW
jgi:hypothetical protein